MTRRATVLRYILLLWLMLVFQPFDATSAPRVALPEMPADGSGVYRVNLDQALGAAPLTLVVEMRRGKAVRAAALPNRNAQAWCAADASLLALDGQRLRGTVTIECPTVFDPKRHRVTNDNGERNKTSEPYLLKTVLTAEYTFDIQCKGGSGSGTWSAKWHGDAKASPLAPWMRRNEEGVATLVREPARELPKSYQCDLLLHAALGDLMLGGREPTKPSLWLRVAVEEGKPTRTIGHIVYNAKLDEQPVHRVKFYEGDISCGGGRVLGSYIASLPGVDDSHFILDLEGVVIGRRLVGTAKVQRHRSSKAVTTQWIGFLHDVTDWPLPAELLPFTWTWRHDQPADETLAAQAARESLLPVMPGEPGQAGFWTWRKLTPHAPVSTIHPPSFDIQETDGAASYRFDITTSADKAFKKSFLADKPWRPLARAWAKLPPGKYSLVVTALDAAGNELPGPMQMGILEKSTAKPGVVEAQSVAFVKRPSFSGPYAKSSRSELDAALAIGRWHRAHPGLHERRGLGSSFSGNAWTTGGDHGYGVAVADRLWANLAVRDLTTDAAERALAEELLTFNLEDLELHQRHNQPEGYIYDYQGDTPLAYWSGTAIIEAYLATGDARWREVALKLGSALVAQQKENGAFYSPRTDIRDPKTRRGPHGFFTWREGAIEFGAAELLYLFGRMRRDLATDEFVAAEAKAYEWVMEHGVHERYWPINVSHSISTGYPIWQHPVAALYFSRYLLECASADRRDVKLAAEVARWAEDVGVDWTRAPQGEQHGPITPQIPSIDRYNNDPLAVNMLAAIVFEQLAQATGDKLWSAKGDALVTAVQQSLDPATGQPSTALVPNSESRAEVARGYGDPAHYRHWDFCKGWAAQLLREYAALPRK